MAQPEQSAARPALSQTAERVLRSETFSRSPRLRRFLEFVVHRSVENRPQEINEYSIGVEVFDKGKNYDPKIDNIVRVTARQLRQKLAEYYSGEGLPDPTRLVIPKGSYVPVLEPNLPDEPPAEPITPAVLPLPTSKWLVLATLLAVAGWGTALLVWRLAPPKIPAEPAYLLESMFSDKSRPLTVVLEDPILAKAWGLVGEWMPFDEFIGHRYLSRELYKTPEAKYLRELLNDNHYVQFPALYLNQRIASIAATRGMRATPITCRTLTPDKVESGNFVFIGGVGSNPWVAEIQKHLAFEHRVDAKQGTRPFINRSPRPGEQAVFQSGRSADSGATYYTRIAVLDNPFGSGKAALLGGSSHELATEAAGQFALSQEGVDQVRKLCGAGPEALKSFELLLETKRLGNTPVKRTIVASRCTK